jgi:uncharacterized membrane protein
MSTFPLRYPVSLLLALLLAVHGIRKKSLSPSGALTAFLVGFLSLSAPTHVFGVSLISFYLVGSRITKIGKRRKAALEEGHTEAGYRNAGQVLCNSATALAACVGWMGMFDAEMKGLVGRTYTDVSYDGATWCPLSSNVGDGWSRYLLLITLG